MKRTVIIIAAICTVFFASCEDKAVRDGRKAYKQYFNETLKDPKSLVIHEETIIKDGDVTVKFKVDMGAKNSYGGFVRENYEFVTVGGELRIVNGKLY